MANLWSTGTGLFIGSGSALSTGGPAALVISYCTLGIMLFCTVHALGEMAVIFPVAGSFSAYSSRFLDPAWGFAMGWNYAMQWLVTLPIEIMAASMTLNYWRGGRDVNPSAWVSIFFMVIIAINFFGVRGYGEAEFVFSIVKVIAVLGFMYADLRTRGVDQANHILESSLLWSMSAVDRRDITLAPKPGKIRGPLPMAFQGCGLCVCDVCILVCRHRVGWSRSSRGSEPTLSTSDSHQASLLACSPGKTTRGLDV